MSLNLLNRRLISVNDRIESLTVKAPHDGMLLRSTSRMTGNKLVVGDMIWDGMALFTIPNMNTMKVMISASEISYKRIEIGNPITYTFDAIPNDTAWGKITQKTPIGKPVKRGSKVKVFDMEASVDSSLQIPTPGLSVECKIMLRSVPDTIVVPQIAVFDEDSIKVVYVKTNKGFERRQVLTGISSPKETVISQGLSPNEKVALLKPASSLVRNNTLLPDSITITDVVSRDVDIKDTHKKKKRIK
jgi:multidrug efflux pump subunit AcrA (membrane-fusion protein)